MTVPVATHTGFGEPDAAAVLEELGRLEQSEMFRYSERMCRLLRFLVKHSLDHPDGQPKEFIVARKVFDKPETFDARIDPIVRVEASRLRAKLKTFYLGEGAKHPVSILLPKRGYRVTFQHHNNPSFDVEHRQNPPALVSPSWSTSVLVLPFVDMTHDHAEEYFCDGIAEELINSLARMKGLNVVSRTAAFRFKGAVGDVREFAESLGVSAVVEGSVRRDGDTLRVSVQVLSARDGFHIWAERYEGSAAHIFRMQDEIARAVMDALKIQLQVQPGPVTDTIIDDADSSVFHLYLKGLHAWNRRTEEGFRQAVSLLEQAAALGPASAQTRGRIFAKMAHSHIGLLLCNAVDPQHALASADAAATSALAAEPSSGEAMVVEAFVKAVRDWNWRESKAIFQRAIEEAPRNPTTHEWYAIASLLPTGKFVECETRLRMALDLDPVSAILHTRRGAALYLQGRLDEATAELELSISLDPEFHRARWYLGRVHTLAGRYEKARDVLERARRLQHGHPFRPGILGHTLAVSGQTAEAKALLESMRRDSAQRFVSPFCMAETLVGLGDHEGALAMLEKAAEQRTFPVICLGIDPIFIPLHQEPAFQRLMERIGLPTIRSM